ncbi:PfkB family carbohydrate kinase [Streptomyces sp. NPDC007084]|uniref:carbohydrate kinase family protein n=1 Tax=Streptomyces sp. NPDC007084 TaxID=3154313 RepID=UPI003452197A
MPHRDGPRMNPRSTDVTVYGETSLHVVTSARPAADVGFGTVELAIGGPAAVVAAQLAALGNTPTLVSQVGVDPAGDFLRTALETAGVDCRFVRSAGRTGRIVAGVADGQVELAADSAADALIGPENLPLPTTGLVYVTGFPALVPVIKELSSNGHRMVVDVGYIPFLSQPDRLAAHITDIADAVDTAVVSGASLSATVRESIQELCLAEGASTVLTTLADHGVMVTTANGTEHLPAVPADVVDPLCAGDAFVAGFMSRRAAGDDVISAAAYAQYVAAAKVQMFGSLPRLSDVEELRK